VYQYILIALLMLAGLIPKQGCAMINYASEGRSVTGLSQWRFLPDTSEENSDIRLPTADVDWSTVSIPHCFRLSGLPEKSAAFYAQTLQLDGEDADKCVYICHQSVSTPNNQQGVTP